MLLLVSTALAVPQAKAVKDTFRDLQRGRPECVVTPGRDALAYDIRCGDDDPVTMFLDRLVAVCATGKEECSAYRANLVAGLVTNERDTPLSLDHIVPVMRSHAYVVDAEAMFAADGNTTNSLLVTPYGSTLDMLWRLDMPTSMRPLVVADLGTLNTNRVALEAAAKVNCARLFQVTDRMDEGDFHLILGAEYTACALLADPDALAKGTSPVTWASMPTAGLVVFSTSTQPNAVLQLQTLTSRLVAASSVGDRPLDSTVFRRTATGWEAMPL